MQPLQAALTPQPPPPPPLLLLLLLPLPQQVAHQLTLSALMIQGKEKQLAV